MTTVSRALSNLGREALKIVLPAWCVVCDKDLPWRDRVASCCGTCWRALPRIDAVKCTSCALPLSGVAAETAFCLQCTRDPLPLAWCEAWGEYRDGLERLLHAFKFQRHDFLDRPLGSMLAAVLRDRDFDAIVPVPMHPARKRRRGYNQAELLAHALARETRIACEPSLLEKIAEKQTQSTLARAERVANVKGVFEGSAAANGRSILIVDDICTTGETLRACATALTGAGAKRIAAVAVAKAV